MMVICPYFSEKLVKIHNPLLMAFWDNVLLELDYLGMTNKALAEKAGFDASNIGRGIRLGSSPSVETAVRIAKVLNVSVEYLVSGADAKKDYPSDEDDLRLLHKYSKAIKALDVLPEKVRVHIIDMICALEKEYTAVDDK